LIRGGSISRVASVVVHNSRRSGRGQSSKCLSISRCRRGSRDGRPQTRCYFGFCRSGDGGSSGGVDNRGISGSGRRGIDIRDGIRRVDNRDGRRRVDRSGNRNGRRRVDSRCGKGGRGRRRKNARCCSRYRVGGSDEESIAGAATEETAEESITEERQLRGQQRKR